MTRQPWEQRLADLLAGRHTATGDELDAGAQMVVTDPDGTEAFRAALARHHRFEGSSLLWVRPVLGGAVAAEFGGAYVFNLSVNRRRGLLCTRARLYDGDVVLTLASGQTARIQPARGRPLEELRRWDDFTLTILTAAEEAELARLDTDSWYGRFGLSPV